MVGPVRVVVLSTGDELVPVGDPVGPGQIVDSNGPMLEALVREAGFFPVHVGHLPDDEVLDSFTYDGAVQVMRVVARTAMSIASAARQPTWNQTSEFREAGERRAGSK